MTVSDGFINFTVNSSTRELKSQDFEEVNNPLGNYRQSSIEWWISTNPVFDIVPCEENETKLFFLDQNCEELAFVSPFSKSKFGFSCKSQTKLTWSKYGNEMKVLHYFEKFKIFRANPIDISFSALRINLF